MTKLGEWIRCVVVVEIYWTRNADPPQLMKGVYVI